MRVDKRLFRFLSAVVCWQLIGLGALQAAEPRQFYSQNGIWYVQEGGYAFEVDPNVVSAKFLVRVDEQRKARILAGFRTSLVRENRLGTMDLSVPEGSSPILFVAELRQSGLFEFAEVNTFGRYLGIPNDSSFTQQWGLNNTGQTGGTNDADIDAPEAWDAETGSPSVVVAVADSGTQYLHPDLQCNIWVNPGEDIDGDGVVWDVPDDIDGVDNDGNGKVDDLIGWDFGSGDNDPDASFYHGTHVAGIVGACTHNGQGIAGVAGGWGAATPGTKMMPLMVSIGSGPPMGSILDDAIVYAADNGAKVITMSLTVGSSTAIDNAVDYAYIQKGVFLNNASGNNNGPVGYPATHTNVVAVGATDHNDNRAGFSNFGPQLEVVAPGVNILSTRLGGGYGAGDGTSYASPHVAGLAALLFAHNPGTTNVDVRECINSSADDLGAAGRDDFYGNGRINAPAALECIGGGVPFEGKAYDFWVSRSFGVSPYEPFHDCARFSDTQMYLDNCGDAGPLTTVPLNPFMRLWIGSVPCGGLNLTWIGTMVDGSILPEGLDVVIGNGLGQTEQTSFSGEGLHNPDCSVFAGGANRYAKP